MTAARAGALHLPALLVVAAALAVVPAEGGFPPTVWYPLALFALGLLVVALVVAPPARGDRDRLAGAAVLLFGLLVVWSYASIAWAEAPAEAWEGANRTLLHWLVVALVALRPWSAPVARAALGLVALGAGALAAWTLADAAGAPASAFLDGRLSAPLGYANASASLWLVAAFPALHLAVAREWPWPGRGVALAAATLLVGVALLTQSRGAAAALLVATAAFVLLHPRRWPALAAAATVAGLLALAWPSLVAVLDAGEGAALAEAARAAARSLALATVAAFLAGCAAAAAGARLGGGAGVPAPLRRRADQGMLLAAGLVAVAAVALAATHTGWLDARWTDFRGGGYAQVDAGATRFDGALGSSRYDFYRVAWDEFRAHPVGGIGADGFQTAYLRDRATPEAPRYPHSLGFSVLAGLGAVGIVLLGAFLVTAGAAGARRRLQGTPAEQGVVVAGLAGFAVWLVQAMVDWLWQFPAPAILALALLALAARTGSSGASPGPGRVPRRAALALLGVGATAAAVSLGLPGVAARFERAGYAVQRTAPELAVARLARAAELNPLAVEPLIGRAVLVRRLGRRDEAFAALEEALRRRPSSWFAHFEVALLHGQAGRAEAARRRLAAARRLNPRQPFLPEIEAALRRGERIDPDRVEAKLARLLGRDAGTRQG